MDCVTPLDVFDEYNVQSTNGNVSNPSEAVHTDTASFVNDPIGNSEAQVEFDPQESLAFIPLKVQFAIVKVAPSGPVELVL